MPPDVPGSIAETREPRRRQRRHRRGAVRPRSRHGWSSSTPLVRRRHGLCRPSDGRRCTVCRRRSTCIGCPWVPATAGSCAGAAAPSKRVARHEHRAPARPLSLGVRGPRSTASGYVIEMTPVWRLPRTATAASSAKAPLGSRRLGRSRLFRYEVHCWRGGVIPDVGRGRGRSPRAQLRPATMAQRVLDLVATSPRCTWGRDEHATGDMWNSNSLTSWLLASSGHDTADIRPPADGRAPGWSAGLAVAAATPSGRPEVGYDDPERRAFEPRVTRRAHEEHLRRR